MKILSGGQGGPIEDEACLIAGVDEAGRGPLAGAVVAAAVILHPAYPIAGINDSKKLSPRRREQLAIAIRAESLAWAIAWSTTAEIDELNILHASLLAMRRAVQALPVAAMQAQIDGNRCPEGLGCPAVAVIGGDGCVDAIGAASILAKVARDSDMLELHARHPEYGFDRHKGYPTQEHLAALRRHGPIAEHRRSFGPVKELVLQPGLPLQEV